MRRSSRVGVRSSVVGRSEKSVKKGQFRGNRELGKEGGKGDPRTIRREEYEVEDGGEDEDGCEGEEQGRWLSLIHI